MIEQLEKVRRHHKRDLEAGFGRVYLASRAGAKIPEREQRVCDCESRKASVIPSQRLPESNEQSMSFPSDTDPEVQVSPGDDRRIGSHIREANAAAGDVSPLATDVGFRVSCDDEAMGVSLDDDIASVEDKTSVAAFEPTVF